MFLLVNTFCMISQAFVFLRFLKHRYKNGKLVLYINDLLRIHGVERFESIKKDFDLILTFNRNDVCDEVEYYGCVHSKFVLPDDPLIQPIDFFYAGSDAGRISTVIDVIKKIKDWKTVIYLVNVSDESKKKLKNELGEDRGIFNYGCVTIHIDEFCPYQRYLSYINKCKCQIEILYEGQSGGTLRLAETMMYKRKLFTNFQEVGQETFFRSNNILIFDNIQNITNDRIKSFLDAPIEQVDYDFSPLRMIKYAESRLFPNVERI